MKATIKQPELAKALDLARRALATKPTTPILNHLLITAENGLINISATDLHLGISATVAADVAEDGQITVDGPMFGDWVKALPSSHAVSLAMPSAGRRMLSVAAGPAKCTINCLDPRDYPISVAYDDSGTVVSVGGQQLAALIKQVAIAAATETSRPILAGVLVEAEGSQLSMAAADGFRLAAGSVELHDPVASKLSAVVPASALRELATMAGEQSSPVAFGLNPTVSRATAQLFGAEWLSSLIDGTFVDYRQIVPRTYTTEVVIDRGDLLAACKRARGFAKDNSGTLRLKVSEESVLVSAIAMERGNTETALPAEITGPGLDIMVEERYFTSSVTAMDTEHVFLGFNGPKHAIVIQPGKGDALTHVVMPKVTVAEEGN